MPKAPHRTKRRPPGRRRVTSRDLRILAFVATMQPVSTKCIQSLLSASMDVALRRARAMRDLGYLKVAVPVVAGVNCYLLTQAGRELLDEAGVPLLATPRVLRGLGRNLRHHLGSSRFVAQLVHASRASGRLELVEALPEREVRRMLGANTAGRLVPDTTLVMRTRAGHTFAAAVEVDTGSERNPSWVAARKGSGYGELHLQCAPLRGISDWVVLFVVLSSRRRVHRLVRAFHDADLPLHLFFFALAGDLTERNVLSASSWQRLDLDPAGQVARLVHQSPFQRAVPPHPPPVPPPPPPPPPVVATRIGGYTPNVTTQEHNVYIPGTYQVGLDGLS